MTTTSRKYARDELLSLRKSPLVCKPASLPPVEEWMGPMLDQSQVQNRNGGRTANKGRNEDGFAGDSTTNRRPLFEARAKSMNVPEDIILGPPKTAFASAAGTGNAGKNFDSPQRSSFTNHDESNAKNDRNNSRERYTRDGQRNERDRDKARDSRPGAVANRRSVKDDSDLWSNVRQPRASGQDDGERPYRRNGDRENDKNREGGRETRGQRGFENHRRDGDRDRDAEGEYGARRAGPGRGRNEPPWARDEGRTEEGGIEDQETTKTRDWRDKDRRRDRVPERDWNKGAKADMDPEWMDALEPEDKKQRHTEDDLKAFMESMKTANGVTQDPPVSQVEQQGNHEQTVSATSTAKSKVDTPLVVDSSFDGFFGLWKEPKNDREAPILATNGAEAAVIPAGRPAKPSKFTGFFNPKPEPEPVKEQPALPLFAPSKDSSSEDKEGFQRILSLLGQQQQQQNGAARTPPRNQALREAPASPPVHSPQARETNDLYSLPGARSPPGNAVPKTRDSEFLLNLMKHTQQGRHDLSQANANGRPTGQDTTRGLLPFSNMMISPHDTPQQTNGLPPGFFTDSTREGMPIRDKLNPNSATEQRAPPPGFYDTSNFPRQSPAGPPQHSGFPPGIQRPPGLEQFQHMHSQRQGMAPPPGFQTPSRGQNTFPPGLISNNPNFGIAANGRGMPPPGYMNGPPPGFSPPFSHEGLPYGGFW